MKNISGPTPIAGRSDMSPSGLGKSLLSPLTLGLVSCSAVGAFLFTATYLIEGLWSCLIVVTLFFQTRSQRVRT